MTVSERVRQVRAGDRRAIAALMRDLDDDRSDARQVLGALQSDAAPVGAAGATGATGPGVVVGVTGGPGAGKSTLVDALVAHWRVAEPGRRVGVVAVDPSSIVGGGAVLGDRVRMQRHATDEGVFIRSVASRGALGGLSRSVTNVVAVLLAAGFSRVVVETVGAGQSEVDIAGAADVTVVVLTPGLGDDVQMLKSGILELADVLVVNKADGAGADAVVGQLQTMLGLREAAADRRQLAGVAATSGIDVPIVKTVATTGQGVAALAAAIEAQWEGPRASESSRRLRRAATRIRAVATARFQASVDAALAPGGAAATLVEDVAALRLDPHAAADALMTRLGGGYLPA